MRTAPAFLIAAACIAAWAALVALMLAWARPAGAHEWYPPACCSSRDCFPLPPGAVTATPEGWRIEATGEVIPYAQTETAPPKAGGTFHRCTRNGEPNGETLNFMWGPKKGRACLFISPGGM